MRGGIFTPYGLRAALIGSAVIVVALVTVGGALFGPGELGQGHEALAQRCDECHASSPSAVTMTGKCLACHRNIQQQRADSTSLHARVDSAVCTACHTDHRGSTASLTRADALFSYDHPRFPLTGAHAGIRCAGCHGSVRAGQPFKRADSKCVSCHQKDDKHNGAYGADCGGCHSDETWSGVNIRHTFPLSHGTRGGPSACDVCHPDAGNWKSYTCYGCHEHTPARILAKHDDQPIRNLSDCVRCHPTGREHD